MTIREFGYKLFTSIFKKEIIRDAFIGLLGREPEEEALLAYKGSLPNIGLKAFLTEIATSDESWEKQKVEHSEEIIRSVYNHIIGCDLEESEFESYKKRMKEIGVEGIVKEILKSKTAWKKAIHTYSENIVTELYEGILQRMPDEAGFSDYKSLIEKDKTLVTSLTKISRSRELQTMLKLESNKELGDVVEGLSLALKPNNQTSFSKELVMSALEATNSIATAVEKIKNNEGYLRYIKESTLIPEEVEEELKNKITFLHIDKTAGTTIQEVLKNIYGKDKVLLRHEDPLFMYSASDLLKFSVIGGHFNYDSIRYSKLEKSKIITYFRDPVDRFESLYNFWRSHDETHINYVIFHRLADTLKVKEFLTHKSTRESRLTWNHMTWAVMGNSIWKQWRGSLDKCTDTHEKQHIINTQIKPAIRRRLGQLYFIGEQETFDESTNTLLKKLGLTVQHSYVKHNSTSDNVIQKPGFKINFEKVIFNSEERFLIENSMLEIDLLLYSEFKKMREISRYSI